METNDMIFCQSCGMPLQDPSLCGSEADGSQSADYCTYCYQNGTFTANVSMEEMIEISLPHMVAEGMPEAEARAMMTQFFPQLKRWQ